MQTWQAKNHYQNHKIHGSWQLQLPASLEKAPQMYYVYQKYKVDASSHYKSIISHCEWKISSFLVNIVKKTNNFYGRIFFIWYKNGGYFNTFEVVFPLAEKAQECAFGLLGLAFWWWGRALTETKKLHFLNPFAWLLDLCHNQVEYIKNRKKSIVETGSRILVLVGLHGLWIVHIFIFNYFLVDLRTPNNQSEYI